MFKTIVTVWAAIIGTIWAVIILALIVRPTPTQSSTQSSTTPAATSAAPQPANKTANKTVNVESIWDVKAQARTVPYDELARNPGNYQGVIVVFNGKVLQAIESGEYLTLRIDVRISERGRKIGSDVVYVDYRKNSPNEPRILEGDKVEFWGKYIGIYSYTAVLGQTIQIPHVVARAIEGYGPHGRLEIR